MSDFFFCDPLEDKMYIIRPVATSTDFRSSIYGLSTKRDTSTLNDIQFSSFFDHFK
jgi:hypothetical protein